MADLKSPVADRAEHNAFFPSEYSLSQYVAKKTDFDGFKFDKPLHRWQIQNFNGGF